MTGVVDGRWLPRRVRGPPSVLLRDGEERTRICGAADCV